MSIKLGLGLCLVATVALAQVPPATITLGWDAVPAATGYRVTIDGIVADVGRPPVVPSCACVRVTLPVTAAQTHTVTVAAYSESDNSGDSVPLVVGASCGAGRLLNECWSVGAASLPWTSADIGFVNPPGRVAGGPDGLTLQAGGLAVGGSLDGFQLVSMPIAGNGSLTTRVAALSTGKAGLDWREDTTAVARHVALTLTATGTVDLLLRTTRSGTTRLVASQTVGPLPVWLRLARGAANTFTGSFSIDGNSWTTVGSVAQPLPNAMRLGLIATGLSSTVATTVQYTNITKVP